MARSSASMCNSIKKFIPTFFVKYTRFHNCTSDAPIAPARYSARRTHADCSVLVEARRDI